MYAVVGCSSCGAFWILEGRQETATCPRCGTRHRYRKLKRFVETDDADHAREVRAALLADRGDHRDAFDEVAPFAELEAATEERVVDDEEYLTGQGVDAEEVAAAGESRAPSRSRKDTVLAAIRELDDPTEEAIVEYATARDVPPEYVDRALEKLARAGEISEHRGRYRVL